MTLEMIIALILVFIAVGIYFFPTLIASSRGHHNTAAIFVLNAFLGWTFLGWVIALVWACTIVWRPQSRTE